MKKRTLLLLFILLLGNSFMFCQEKKDSLNDSINKPIYYDLLSPEESWKIHREAFLKQLKSKNLTAKEIEKEIAIYEKQKKDFIENMFKQRKLASLRRKNAEKLREKAELQRKQADIQSQKAKNLRGQAEVQRKQADILRKRADEQKSQNLSQKKKAEELRKQAAIQRQYAEKLRDEAEIEKKKAHILRNEAAEWRNSSETIFRKEIAISNQSINSKPIIIKVKKKTSLLFSIICRISSGNTLVEIFNPNGEKKGELSLEYITKSEINGGDEFLKSTAASLNKTISYAEAGDWQIKISSQKSKGNISISVAQSIKSTMDD